MQVRIAFPEFRQRLAEDLGIRRQSCGRFLDFACLAVETRKRVILQRVLFGRFKALALLSIDVENFRPGQIAQFGQRFAQERDVIAVDRPEIAQAEILKLIPGLEEAEFVRLGQMHRNTFIKSTCK